MEALLERARHDARAMAEGGCDALIVENFGDVPFFGGRVPSETVAAMAVAVTAVRDAVGDLEVGVNVLRNDARSALALCAATGASFVRVNVHTGSAVSDQGLLVGRAAETLRERERLCPDVRILADVQVKHAVPLAPRPIADEAEDAWRRGGADAIVVSGRATGSPPDAADLLAVRERIPECPVLVGSGLTSANAHELMRHATGVICGTAFELDGEVAADRVERVVRSVRG